VVVTLALDLVDLVHILLDAAVEGGTGEVVSFLDHQDLCALFKLLSRVVSADLSFEFLLFYLNF
jgi:hypothetical protein